MIKNKKYFIRMLSLAFFVCSTSVFVKGCWWWSKKETPTFIKWKAHKDKGEEWIKKNKDRDK